MAGGGKSVGTPCLVPPCSSAATRTPSPVPCTDSSDRWYVYCYQDVDVRGPRYCEGMQVYPPNPPPGPPQKPRLSLNMRDPDAMAEDLDR